MRLSLIALSVSVSAVNGSLTVADKTTHPSYPRWLDLCRTAWFEKLKPDVVADSLELGLPVQQVGSWNPSGSVKPMTYKIDTCRYLGWCLALIG